MKKEGIAVKNYWEKLSGKQLFKYVWKFKNSDERKAAREYAVQRGYAIRCDTIASAFDHILTVPDEGELADRLTGGRSSRPSRFRHSGKGGRSSAGCSCGGLPGFGGSRKYVVDGVAAGGACADVPLLAGDAPPRMGCDYDGLGRGGGDG